MAGEHYEEKERFDGKKVKILMSDYIAGTDQDRYQWRTNINFVNIGEQSDPINRYLKTAERYFYSKEGFGSEKRKNPA
ncbi:MAG: hypothetical protein WCG29_11820 [Desulfomonile sp.]|jgi:hypothetical protein